MIDLSKKYILAVVGIVSVAFVSVCVFIIAKSTNSKPTSTSKINTDIHTDINKAPVKISAKLDKQAKPIESVQMIDSNKSESTKKEDDMNNVVPSTPKKDGSLTRNLPQTPHSKGDSIGDELPTICFTPKKVGSLTRVPPRTPHSIGEKK